MRKGNSDSYYDNEKSKEDDKNHESNLQDENNKQAITSDMENDLREVVESMVPSDQSLFSVVFNSSYLKKQNDITSKRKLDDVEEDDIYDNFEVVSIKDSTLIVGETDIRSKFLWNWNGLTSSPKVNVEEVTSILITSEQKNKNYANESFMGVNSLEKLCESI
ncbi:4402_t:CDS:2 [Funneliformis mosseae]|uniref:4402_t:CDS:1 n=1 Tax=Funneliformis mosseae TaxID=27381 RepID=A0A9N9BNW4_FUNMO|nr:4402_t:CDS:2 [Funneliformis mosseae]